MSLSDMDDKSKLYIDRIKSDLEKETLPESAENTLWNRIDLENRRYEKAKRLHIITISISVAASVVLLFVLSLTGSRKLPDPEADYLAILESTSAENLHPSEIQLLLSGDQKLSIDGKESEIDYQKEGEVRINGRKLEITEKENQEQALNQLIVPVGKRSFLTLSDGTRMWVNSDTRVIYPVQFTGNKREIFVDGEVFLDVSPDTKMPFVVKTKHLDVTVLGTEFNVSTFNEKSSLEVVLVSGKVEVKTSRDEKKILSPNQLFSYDNETQISLVHNVDVIDYVAWKDGYYRFRQQPLDIVLRKIAKYYGVVIEWEEAVGSLSCSGKLDLRNDPKEVYATLERAAPVEITDNNESIYIKVKP